MERKINYGDHVFTVPAAVADHFLRLASADQLRVLLYFLRHAEEPLAPEQIADFLKLEAEDVTEALDFWTQANVLHAADRGQAMTFRFSAPRIQPALFEAPKPAVSASPAQPLMVQKSSKDVHPTPQEIAAEIEKSSDLASLYALTEKALGRVLKHSEQCSLLWMHEYLNIPDSVILMLVHYCSEIGKYSVAYVESIAVSWYENGIVTVEAAEHEIQRMMEAHTYTGAIVKMFELKRSPTSKQKALIEKWKAAGHSMELIRYAYEITVENTDSANFSYIDKILEDLAGKGITTPEAAAKDRAESAPKRKRGKNKKENAPLTEQEQKKMNDYLSLVNRFKEDEE